MAFRFGFFSDLGCDNFQQVPGQAGEFVAVELLTMADHGGLGFRFGFDTQVGGEFLQYLGDCLCLPLVGDTVASEKLDAVVTDLDEMLPS